MFYEWGSNTVTVVVSTRDVQEKIVNMTSSVTLNFVNERNNVMFYNLNKN